MTGGKKAFALNTQKKREKKNKKKERCPLAIETKR